MNAMAGRFALLLLAAVFVFPAARADDKIAEMQLRFDREANSVRKAKLLDKLGNAQLAKTRAASHANDYVTVGFVMEKYRDNVRAAFDALRKQHPNAERQLSGYKELQIHVHLAIRRLDETILLAPDEYKPPLQLVHRDLESIDDELLKLIFPRQPPPNSASAPATLGKQQ